MNKWLFCLAGIYYSNASALIQYSEYPLRVSQCCIELNLISLFNGRLCRLLQTWLNLDIHPKYGTLFYTISVMRVTHNRIIQYQWTRNVPGHEHNHSCVSPSLRAVCPLRINSAVVLSTNVASDSQEWEIQLAVVLKTKELKEFSLSSREKSMQT